ncbi:FecR family protein [Zobellia uliginosa]|uniref:FecR family protein n=1 Tax=Zobellia uliginosa TaxID=143224 RepID=UPI0026E2F819|nr:FecR domain-containing protein [Zobellia uliginosa]MDO6518702.1 DUF4974 domain-containing protein [Zobellia uliginosa]
MKNKEILKIISKSFDKKLTASEQEVLNHWLSSSDDNKAKYEGYRYLWEQAETLVSHDHIDVEAALLKTKAQIGDFKKKRFLQPAFVKIAASVALLLSIGLGSGYLLSDYGFGKENTVTGFQQVEAMHGTNTKLLLDDGTSVWLNSGSTLRFPVSFGNEDERRVVLTGEAFFDVEKDKDKPFVVQTSDVDVRVHGTSFNVSAYTEDKSITVALVEGKVTLEKEQEGEVRQLAELKPDQVVMLDKKSRSIMPVTDMKMNQFTGWKDGLVVFYGDSITTVAQRLGKWYNVEVDVEKALGDYRFTATIQNESLEQVLDLLSMSSPMTYKIIPAKLNEDNTFSQRKVILTTKKRR